MVIGLKSLYNIMINLNHPEAVKLLQMAYSAERAAAFAYVGHANSVKNQNEKKAIKQIEDDEWHHNIPVSKWYEFRFYVIGKLISFSCYVIGWFMPFYFAGRLESGNVCEYFRLKIYFNSLGITKHDQVLYDMGIKEKEHEVYFYEQIKNSKLLPYFEKFFNWGATQSFNNIDLQNQLPVEKSDVYCQVKSKSDKT
jgi:rubrerythrin